MNKSKGHFVHLEAATTLRWLSLPCSPINGGVKAATVNFITEKQQLPAELSVTLLFILMITVLRLREGGSTTIHSNSEFKDLN